MDENSLKSMEINGNPNLGQRNSTTLHHTTIAPHTKDTVFNLGFKPINLPSSHVSSLTFKLSPMHV